MSIVLAGMVNLRSGVSLKNFALPFVIIDYNKSSINFIVLKYKPEQTRPYIYLRGCLIKKC
jgi:hypothetical protein